ncbi:Ankyrin-3 [Dactylella cylindrospora]|nr:Ankyrin-3 [Dactylella cylindrospora]
MEAAAAITGFIALAEVFVTKGSKYYSAIKGAIPEISALLSEVTELYGVLNSLHLVIVRLGTHGVELGQHNQQGKVDQAIIRSEYLLTCRSNISQLQGLLEKFDPESQSKWALFKLKMLWPLKAHETEELTKNIQHNKTNIQLALQVNELSALLSALKAQEDMQQLMEKSSEQQNTILKSLERIELDSEKRRILEWASSIDPRASQSQARKLRYDGTSEWFVDRDEYVKWMATGNSRLWLYGIPGAGKTIMISSIIDKVQQQMENTDALTFHYCNYRSRDSQVLEYILCSLIMQASKQSKSAFQLLREFYLEYNPEKSTRSFLRDCPVDLAELLQQISKEYTNLIIVMDGLDECTVEREYLLEQLDRLCDAGSGRIKILVSSRPEQDIDDMLTRFERFEVSASKSDLELYCASEMEKRTRSRKLRLRDPSLKQLILDRLVQGSHGMFQWVVCQLDTLCELGSDKERKDALDNLPAGLHATYQRILERVVSGKTGGKKIQERLRHILRWLAFCEAPLKLKQLSEAVSDIVSSKNTYDASSIIDQDAVLRWGGSLIRLNRETECVEFSHFTVKSFLLDPEVELPENLRCFQFDLKKSHRALAKVCLDFLSLENFGNKGIKHEDTTTRSKHYEKYPFLEYADGYWYRHLKRASPDWGGELDDLITKFLFTGNLYFSKWREVDYSLEPKFSKDLPIGLHVAAVLGFSSVVKEFVNQSRSVNMAYPGLGSPLSLALMRFCEEDIADLQASESGYNDVIQDLLRGGADPNLSIEENRYSDRYVDPFWTFFKPRTYDRSIGLQLFSRLAKPISGDAVDKLNTRFESGWITSSEVVELISCSPPEHWDQNARLKIRAYIESKEGPEGNAEQAMSAGMLTIADRSNPPDSAEPLTQESSQIEKSHRHLPAFLAAAKVGSLDVLNEILSCCPSFANAVDKHGGVAVHQACEHGQDKIVAELLRRGAPVNTTDALGRTPLHQASRSLKTKCVGILLENGADVNQKCDDGLTPLMAVWDNNWMIRSDDADWQETSDILLNAENLDLNLRSTRARTYLHYAAALPDAKYARFLLERNAPVDALDNSGSTPLHWLATQRKPSFEVASLLLDHGADVNALNKRRNTPLALACKQGSPSLIKTLVTAGASIKMENSDGLLVQHIAASHHDSSCLATLLEVGGAELPIDTKSRFCKRTVLHFAAANGSAQTGLRVAESLLGQPGIDFESKDASGRTPLMLAAVQNEYHWDCRGQLERFKFFATQTGASINDYDGEGENALSLVLRSGCRNCFDGMFSTLIAHSKINLESKFELTGLTPLLYAIGQKHAPHKIDALLQAGALTSATSLEHQTALHRVCDMDMTPKSSEEDPYEENPDEQNQFEYERIVDLLLANNLDINAQDASGMTALMLASHRGSLSLVTILIEHGANIYETCREGYSAVHYALVSENVIPILEALIGAGADLRTPVSTGRAKGATLLTMAIESRKSTNILRLLLDAGCDVLAIDADGLTCLQLAINLCCTEYVELLLKKIPRIDCKQGKKIHLCHDTSVIKLLLQHYDNIAITDLFQICECPHLDMESYRLAVSFIREQKVIQEPEAPHEEDIGRLAFGLAFASSNVLLQEFLREWRPELTGDDPTTTRLHTAIKPLCVRDTASFAPKQDDQDWFDQFVAIIVQENSDYSSLETFLGNNIFEKNKNSLFYAPDISTTQYKGKMPGGVTILQVALYEKNYSFIQSLLMKGCLLKTKDSNGRNGLVHILESDDISTFSFVLKVLETLEPEPEKFALHEDNVYICRCCGEDWGTAMHFLAHSKGWQCAAMLVEKAPLLFQLRDRLEDFSILEMYNYFGRTPLMCAAISGNLEFIKRVMKYENKPDMNQIDFRAGRTAFRLAMDTGHFDVARYLIENGAKEHADETLNQNIEVFRYITDRASLENLLSTGVDGEAWDSNSGYPLHVLLRRGYKDGLETMIAHLGPDKAIAQILKPTTLFGHALQIMGHLGWQDDLTTLQNSLGEKFADIPAQCLEEARICADKNGHFELADAFLSLAEKTSVRKQNSTNAVPEDSVEVSAEAS